ncbi:MAG: hypothetical protein ACK5T0_04120, partial [Vampirovibrionales bacterium]
RPPVQLPPETPPRRMMHFARRPQNVSEASHLVLGRLPVQPFINFPLTYSKSPKRKGDPHDPQRPKAC